MQAIVSIEGKTFDIIPDLVQNDKGWAIVFTMKYNDDSVVNLTGATVKFLTKNTATNTVKINGTCTLTTPASGIASYTILATDLDTVGVYTAEVEVTLVSTARYTIKLGKFQVLEEIA